MEALYFFFSLLYLAHCIQAIVRQKRNLYDPSFPAFPNPSFPFFQPWPYPVATPAPSPFESFMPKPPEEFSNPFLKQINEGYNPNFGFGIGLLQPTMIGGSLQYPTGDIIQDKDTVSGTFIRSSPTQIRFGTQGGTLFPWMNKKQPDVIRAADYIGQAGNFQPLARSNAKGNNLKDNGRRADVVPEKNYELSGLPPLPPNFSRFSN